MLVISTWITSPYHEAARIDYDTVPAYFANVLGGYTIETIIMIGAGYALGKTATGYFSTLLESHETIRTNEEQMSEQLRILDSMAEIYDRVNLIDFERMTERPLKGGTMSELKLDFEVHDHTNNEIDRRKN